MKLKDLIGLFRLELSDTNDPPLWQDEELVHHLNQAVQEACERALLIEDRHTPAACHFQTRAGTGTYELHPSIIKIKRISVGGRVLDETSVEELDASSRSWEAHKGQPRYFVFEGVQGGSRPRVRLVPEPVGDVDVRMTVYRGALAPLRANCENDKPELPASLMDSIKHWVYRCALLKTDADGFDKVRASEHEAIFTAAFGPKVDANTARKRRDRRPPIVRSAW